jgi:hypothetical protein
MLTRTVFQIATTHVLRPMIRPTQAYLLLSTLFGQQLLAASTDCAGVQGRFRVLGAQTTYLTLAN